MRFDTIFSQLNLLSQSPLTYDNSSSTAPVVHLRGYGYFQGLSINTTLTARPIPKPVDSWLGIDYAIQPLGDLRFRPLKSRPSPFSESRNATHYGKICPQDHERGLFRQDEACLNFNVYRTQGIPFSRKLPTLVWIHGGSFVEGSGRSLDGAAFVASSNFPIAVVTFNYRLNALGFLPSKLFAEEGLLNLGLRDQRFFLEFLQTHLSSFGGDPNQITLAGRSAGAHSTGIHYYHNYGSDAGKKPLFARAMLHSGAVTGRAFPDHTYPHYVQDFKRFMFSVGCSMEDSNKEQLDCLRAVPVENIRKIAIKMYIEAEATLSWPFQPTLGGPLLEKPGSRSGIEGTFHHLPLLTTYTTDEGKFYTPGHLETNDDFITFMHSITPDLNITDMAVLNELYPDPITHPESIYAHSPNSTQYNRLSTAWSDMAYICPTRETAFRTSRAGVPTWRLHFNTPDWPLRYQAWRGVPHTSDSRYTFDSPDMPFPRTSHIYHAYLASFVATGDPNRARRGDSPEWPRYEVNGQGRPKQLKVNPGIFTTVVDDDVRVRQCEFWNDPDRAARLHK